MSTIENTIQIASNKDKERDLLMFFSFVFLKKIIIICLFYYGVGVPCTVGKTQRVNRIFQPHLFWGWGSLHGW